MPVVNVTANDLTLSVISKSLGLLSARHEAIAGNIANVNTPGYRRRDIDFEGQLRKALEDAQVTGKKAKLRSVNSMEPRLLADNSFFFRNDLGSVDIEVEMAAQAKTSLLYNMFARLAEKRLRMYRFVIMDGRA